MSTRLADGSSPLLGQRYYGLAEPEVRVGTAAAARNLPVNEAAAAYSFARRYPRLARMAYHTSVAGAMALILGSLAAFAGFWYSPRLTVLVVHKLGFGWDGVQPSTFADSLVRCGKSGSVNDAGDFDLQLWGYFLWALVGLLSALLLQRLAMALYRGVLRALAWGERASPYAYSRVGDTHQQPVSSGAMQGNGQV